MRLPLLLAVLLLQLSFGGAAFAQAKPLPPPDGRHDGPGIWAGIHLGVTAVHTGLSWVTVGRIIDLQHNDPAYAFEPEGDADRRLDRALGLAAVGAGIQTTRMVIALVNAPALLPPRGLPMDRPRFLVTGLVSGVINLGSALAELGVLGAMQAVTAMPELEGPPSESAVRAEIEALLNGALAFVYGGTQVFAAVIGLQKVRGRRRAEAVPWVGPGTIGIAGRF